MRLFCLNGYQGEKISMELKEVIGFPNRTSYEGGYDIICALTIDAGCYHIAFDKLYSATGALYRFCDELKSCYTQLEGQAEYRMFLENDLCFKVVMTAAGHAVITGSFRELPHKNNILKFEIDTDQTCFLSVIQDIESLKEKYGDMEGVK